MPESNGLDIGGINMLRHGDAIFILRERQYMFEQRIKYLDTLFCLDPNAGEEAQGNIEDELSWTREQINELGLAIKHLEEAKIEVSV